MESDVKSLEDIKMVPLVREGSGKVMDDIPLESPARVLVPSILTEDLDHTIGIVEILGREQLEESTLLVEAIKDGSLISEPLISPSKNIRQDF